MANLERNTYEPTLPADREELASTILQWLDEEHLAIALALNNLGEGYEVSHNPPVRLRVGMVRYADGTDWNPGSGEGLYVYKSTGWVLLG